MSDVKITEHGGSLRIVSNHGSRTASSEIPPEEAAALEAHYRAKFAAEQPATPTPSIEQVWDEGFEAGKNPNRYGDEEFWRWDDRDSTYYPRFTDGRERHVNPYRAVLASPVPEQPTPLDPEPWEHDCGFCGGDHRLAFGAGHPDQACCAWKPAPMCEQDRARYEQN